MEREVGLNENKGTKFIKGNLLLRDEEDLKVVGFGKFLVFWLAVFV